jgi:uncharacterized protein (UPF0548 family)
MFSLRKPSADFVREYLRKWQDEPFSYPEVGLSRTGVAGRFWVDRHRVCVGHGAEGFAVAQRAVRQWKMFPEEMVELFFRDRPVEVGTMVAVLFRAPGFWSLNPARILYVIDEEIERKGDLVQRFGFAYGTMADHLECGEEQFLVEWNHVDDSVWYHLTAYSRPRHWIVWLGYPYARMQQARFRRLSGDAMQRAVKELTVAE